LRGAKTDNCAREETKQTWFGMSSFMESSASSKLGVTRHRNLLLAYDHDLDMHIVLTVGLT
jgi:hypothetical protein